MTYNSSTASVIKVRDELVADATQLRELQRGAYVSAERGHLVKSTCPTIF